MNAFTCPSTSLSIPPPWLQPKHPPPGQRSLCRQLPQNSPCPCFFDSLFKKWSMLLSHIEMLCHISDPIGHSTSPSFTRQTIQPFNLIQFFIGPNLPCFSLSLSLHIQRIAALLLHIRRQKVQEVNFQKQTVFGKT